MEVLSGGTPSKSEEDYWDGTIPWISGATLHTERLRDSTRRVTEAAIGNGTRLAPREATLILVRGMSLLEEIRVGRCMRSMAFNQDVKALVARPDIIDPAFLTYSVLAARPTLLGWVHQAGHGTGVLATDRLLSLPVPLPPLPEQRAIAGVLGALDDLIDANLRLRASVEGKGEALVRLMAQDGLDLIAGESVEGWVLSSVGDVSSVLESGRRPKGGVREIASGVPSIGAESIDGLGSFDFAKTKYVPEEFAAGMRKGVLESRDVLVYKDGGKPGDFRPHVGMFGDGFPFDHMVINEHVYRVRTAAPLTEPYLYFWLRQPALMDWLKMLGTGAAIPGINSTAFKTVPVAVPPAVVRERLFPVLDALVGEGLAAAKEAHMLRRTRDELLPLLMSGAVSPGEVASGVAV